MDGLAFATNLDGASVVSFGVATGAVRWTYTPPSGDFGGDVRLISAAAGNGLVVKKIGFTTFDALETIVRLEGLGQASQEPWTGFNIQYAFGDLWLGVEPALGSLLAVFADGVEWAKSTWPEPGQDQTWAAEPALRLVAVTDCTRFDGRHVDYRLQKLSGAVSAEKYTVFEYHTDISLAPPYGQSPRDYVAPEEANRFDDWLNPGLATRAIDSQQMFGFGFPGQRRYRVKHLERTLDSLEGIRVRLRIPVLRIHMEPFGEPLINGQPHPYMAPCGSQNPPL